ncbi:SpoIIE family protein phosphatase [Streptomyces adelaidensis]|uniref:SpoIIE family protein phosphatase n=1 Tax=Streptomyces adelaidensis TaxID=2796465 RepID=UPI001F34EF4F|nr:SpoIIE family protein phosphatase [Streptomyces adelaidensis]
MYAVFDPVARTCTYSLAGHAPPVVVHPDGTVHSPHLASDPPAAMFRTATTRPASCRSPIA